MQIKTTMGYHLTPVRMTTTSKQAVMRMWGKGTQCTVGGNADWCSHCGNSMEFTQKMKNGTVFDPAIPLLGMCTKIPETLIRKNLYTPYIHCSIIYNIQDLETAHVHQ